MDLDCRSIPKMVEFSHCRGWMDVTTRPQGIVCPSPLQYPPPPERVDVLFLGWNPPGMKHFWNWPEDPLRRNLAWVLSELGWDVRAEQLGEFDRRKCYFVHSVKCWPYAAWPPEALVRRCAKALLAGEIERLQPQTICVLGHIPHTAIEEVIPGVPRASAKFHYAEGWCGEVAGMELIICAFPNTRWNARRRTMNRECTVEVPSLPR